MPLSGTKPHWLTFDCYGTLIQWDEGLLDAVNKILSAQTKVEIDANALIEVYDKYEHQLEQTAPHRKFRDVAGTALALAMQELGLSYHANDIEILTSSISKMPPFMEVCETLARLKSMGFKLCIISNTDDDIIAGNVAQLGGHIDRVISAEQSQAYKPSLKIFEYAHTALGVSLHDIVHICASPHLDLIAARDMNFRCIWIDRGTKRKALADYSADETYSSLDKVAEKFMHLAWA